MSKLLIVPLALFEFFVLNSPIPAFEDISLNGFHQLAIQCLRSNDQMICKRALLLNEALQQYAGSQEKYRCQTSLLVAFTVLRICVFLSFFVSHVLCF